MSSHRKSSKINKVSDLRNSSNHFKIVPLHKGEYLFCEKFALYKVTHLGIIAVRGNLYNLYELVRFPSISVKDLNKVIYNRFLV